MSASITNITQDKFNYWLLYYIFLGIIQAMWTNLNSFPPTVFRLAMTGAVFAPMILNKDLLTFGFPFFLILRSQLSTPYQYLPDSNSFIFYIFLLFVTLFLLVWTESLPFLDLLFEATAALATAGISSGVSGQLSPLGKLIIIAAMLIGRVGVITFGMALLNQTDEDEEPEPPAKHEDLAV